MTTITDTTWIWVMVQDPGGNEQFVGHRDPSTDIAFIPAFLEKDDAMKCYHMIPKAEGAKYEFQAIEYGVLTRHASENGFSVFILNEDGKVLNTVASDQKSAGSD